MRYCFVVDTPYQLFCVLNIVWSFKLNSHNDSTYDLYMGLNFNKSKVIYNNICEEKIFDNVYQFDMDKGKVRRLGILGYLTHIKRLSRQTRSFLRRVAKAYNSGLLKKLVLFKRYLSVIQMLGGNIEYEFEYDAFFASYYNVFVKNILLFMPEVDICYFEDGSGSYTGNTFDYCLINEPDQRLEQVGIDVEYFRPRKMYVFRPEVCNVPNMQLIKADLLYTKDLEFKLCVNRIFEYKQPVVYQNVDVIFLMTREDEIALIAGERDSKDAVGRYRLAVETVKNAKCNIIFRTHPRQNKVNIKEVNIDDSGCMWELMLLDLKCEDLIIISICSTGAISPKFLYNLEPYNILLHDYIFKDEDFKKSLCSRANLIIDKYSDKSRIVAIRTIEELESTLQGYVVKKNNET